MRIGAWTCLSLHLGIDELLSAHRYTKLHVWNLVEYEKVVYIDADTLIMSNIDELFRRPPFAAAPDVFPPDKFNAGVMVVKPSKDTFQDMVARIPTTESYDGGDTGFLNVYFAGWYSSGAAHRLPFGYAIVLDVSWHPQRNDLASRTAFLATGSMRNARCIG